tara:strand:- start:190 stop:957 length:768 start_codon:yes stop_codon:yes gene_type:complete
MDVNEIGAKDVGNAAKKVAGALGKKIVGNKVSSDSNLSPTLIKQIAPYADQLESVLSNRALRTEFLALIKKVETNTPGPLGGLSGRVYDKFNKGVQGVKGAASAIKSKATKTTDPRKSATQDATAAPTAPKNAAAGDTFEKAKGDIRKVQGGQKPLPPKFAADIQASIAKLAKGDKENGVAAAQKIMKFASKGIDVSKQQQAWIANAKAGERFLTQSVYFEISKMLRENNLRWSDLGMRVHLLEGTNSLFGISLI